MSCNYKNLDLNRGLILETIKKFFETRPDLGAQVDDKLELKNEPTGQYRCYVSTSIGEFFLDMFYRTNGKTTLLSSGEVHNFQN